MDSEFARDRVNKLLLEIAIDSGLNLIVKKFDSLIVDLLYLEDNQVRSSLGFHLEIVCFIGFSTSSYCGVIYFPLFCMI